MQKRRVRRRWWRWGGRVALVAAVLGWPKTEYGYSVQTHEQVIDLMWTPAIVPLLKARYPGLTAAQINEAHAYAYGGCAIQDLGYYPFGNEFFSELTHYVRAGDLVRSLLREAKTADELAFAVGALSHYVGDTLGHSLATNPAVGQEFPKLGARYGRLVTYEEDPHAHVQAEFAFDIDQISKRRFAPSRYLSHVGLKVSGDLLTRAFFETYGLNLRDELRGKLQRTNIAGYGFSVRRFVPRIAYAETVLHRHRMPADVQDAEFTKFEAALRQSELENQWNAYRKSAGIGTYALAGLIYILPKIGPLALLKIKGPDETAEQGYVKSLNATIAGMRLVLADVQAGDAAKLAADLPNRDLDTGAPVRPGAYRLTDEAYAHLLNELTERRKGVKVPDGLKANIEAYYADEAAPISTKKNKEEWARVQMELGLLRQMPTVAEP